MGVHRVSDKAHLFFDRQAPEVKPEEIDLESYQFVLTCLVPQSVAISWSLPSLWRENMSLAAQKGVPHAKNRFDLLTQTFEESQGIAKEKVAGELVRKYGDKGIDYLEGRALIDLLPRLKLGDSYGFHA